MQRLWYVLFLLTFSGCASPYEVGGFPDVPVEARMQGPDLVQLIPSPELTSDCERRAALLLKAASMALENGFTHFDFVGEPYEAVRPSEPSKPIVAHLCRSVCSGMYSADAIGHIVVPIISPSWSAFAFLAQNRQDTRECPEELSVKTQRIGTPSNIELRH
jgi:hypothetical protein